MLKDLALVALALLPAIRRPATVAPPSLPPAALLPPPSVPFEPAPPSAAQPRRRAIANDAAVARFCAWWRDWDFAGWHTAADVVSFYRWFAHDERLEEMHADLLLELLAAAPGVSRERRRLTATSDAQIKRIRRRLGVDRVMLYRVDSHEELAERAAAAKVSARGKRQAPRKRPPATVSAGASALRRAA